jgi:hypothetical protein
VCSASDTVLVKTDEESKKSSTGAAILNIGIIKNVKYSELIPNAEL